MKVINHAWFKLEEKATKVKNKKVKNMDESKRF